MWTRSGVERSSTQSNLTGVHFDENIYSGQYPKRRSGGSWGERQDRARGGYAVQVRAYRQNVQHRRGEHRVRFRRGGDQAQDLYKRVGR